MNRRQFQYHPVIGHTFVPNLKARIDHKGQAAYLISTNAQGFRCRHDFTPSRSTSKLRVLLFGDSFTAGDGVSDKYRYSNLLEAMHEDVEIFNFGIPGTGTDQQYLTYREYGSAIEHDVIVIALQVENINRVNARYRQYEDELGYAQVFCKPYFKLDDDGSLSLHHVPVPKEPMSPSELTPEMLAYCDGGPSSGRFARLRLTINRLGPRIKSMVQRFTHYQPLPAYNSAHDTRWLLLKAIIARWVAEATVPVIVFPIPLYHYVEEMASPRAYQSRFEEVADRPKVVVHDPLPDFLTHPLDERRTFRFALDPHPTAAGHRVLADSLARALQPYIKSCQKGQTCR